MATVRHAARNLEVVATYEDGGVRVRFDCARACGMTGDETVGDTLEQARAAAQGICRAHSTRFEDRIVRAVTGRRVGR